MTHKPEVYLKSIVRRWIKDCSNQSNVTILSPYITSRTAETVTSRIVSCDIYTLFSFEVFVNLSSSIQTLINLKTNGCKIYSLPNIHSKIIIVDGIVVTVGSQNLTSRGNKNLEASVAMRDPIIINKVQSQVSEWKESSFELTLEALEEMRDLVKPFIKDYKQLLAKGKLIDDKLRRKHNLSDEYDKNIRKLKDTLFNSTRSDPSVYGSIDFIYNSPDTGTYSYIPYSSIDLTQWWVAGKVINLERLNRYLCVIENTGKIGWVRVAKGRFTYFADGISRDDFFQIDGYYFKVNFDARWRFSKHIKYNLTITIKPDSSNVDIIFNAWFGIKTLNISFDKYKSNKLDDSASALLKYIQNNTFKFKEYIISILLGHFKYEHKLYGNPARDFFNSSKNDRYKLNMFLINRKPVLVFKKT